MEETLGYEKSERMEENSEKGVSKNYRKGYSQKCVKTQLGEVEVKIPQDRNGEYESKIIAKYDRNATGMEEKILGLYARGMRQRDIAEQIKSLYDVEISPELFVFMDAIHYKVKENHQYITKTAYMVLGIRLDGRKDILGVWIGENESSKFWLSVLNDLKTVA